MAQRKLLTNGNAFLRTDNRWCGVVWYMDERGERKRKSFSGTTKAEVNKKMVDYVAAFDKMVIESDESKKTLEESMTNWLKVFTSSPPSSAVATIGSNARRSIKSTPCSAIKSWTTSPRRTSASCSTTG